MLERLAAEGLPFDPARASGSWRESACAFRGPEIRGIRQFADDQRDIVLNPVLIFEVLSESTRNYDRGWKFQRLPQTPSLIEYPSIEQDQPRVEHWTPQMENHWDFVDIDELGQSIQLTSIGCILPLTESTTKSTGPSPEAGYAENTTDPRLTTMEFAPHRMASGILVFRHGCHVLA
jgi:Uma2 family endonuclease